MFEQGHISWDNNCFCMLLLVYKLWTLLLDFKTDVIGPQKLNFEDLSSNSEGKKYHFQSKKYFQCYDCKV